MDLDRTPYQSDYEVRNGICEKSTTKKIGYVVKPFHRQFLLLSISVIKKLATHLVFILFLFSIQTRQEVLTY